MAATRTDEVLLHRVREELAGTLILPRDWPLLEELAGGGRPAARALLARLKAAAELQPVRRGVYAIRNARGTIRLSTLDLVGQLSPAPYLVTGGRALQEHGLSDQSFREIVVACPAKERPWAWQGDRVRYVRLPAQRIWGGKPRRHGGGTVMLATAERAILDSLAHPGWGVTLAQVVQALDRALQADPTFADRLAQAAARYGSSTLARRLGLLVEELAGAEAARPFLALRGASHAAAALQPGSAAAGAHRARWQVTENVPLALLTDHRRGG